MKEKSVPKRAPGGSKNKGSTSRPVLTSPWKIGTFVALLVVLVSVWVSYYFAVVHGLNPGWLNLSSDQGWMGIKIDSQGFLREMYPLLVCVVIVALASYFVIASAVRRYRFYLDSGQDYRRMIALAESIDDLTDPSQIARLSSFPELQAVLKNYAEQIRAISSDLQNSEQGIDPAELEKDTKAILKAEEISPQGLETKPYAVALKQVRDRLMIDKTRIEELESQIEEHKITLSRLAQSFGRILEAAGGAGEDLMELSKLSYELGRITTERDTPSSPRKAEQQPILESRPFSVPLDRVARKLEDGSRLMQELSNENNGIAIKLALMAARTPVNEHDLASCAEAVREAAERFHKLSLAINETARELLDSRISSKQDSILRPSASDATAESSGLREKIREIAKAFEERSSGLQERLCGLGSELHEMQEMLEKKFGIEIEESLTPRPKARISTSPRKATSVAEEELVIDHGSSWRGIKETSEHSCEHEEERSKGEPEESEEQQEMQEAKERENKADFSEISTLRNLNSLSESDEEVPIADANDNLQAAKSGMGNEAWLEMPGHRWVKVDVDKADRDESGDVPVSFERQEKSSGSSREADREEVAVSSQNTSAREAAATETEGSPEESSDGGEEPIYDLFELGAVECSTELEVER